MEKVKARCYGAWGAYHYYRTESGHTFSLFKGLINCEWANNSIFYHGNVKEGDTDVLRMLNESEKAELFSRVEFID